MINLIVKVVVIHDGDGPRPDPQGAASDLRYCRSPGGERKTYAM